MIKLPFTRRLRHGRKIAVKMEKLRQFEYFFNPRSVAIIGASKTAEDFTPALTKSKMRKNLFLVNPKHRKLFGMKCYANILDIKDKIDYAIIAVPALAVPKVLKECIKKGVKIAHIFSSGFGETGIKERIELEEQIMEIAKGKIRLIGPNCMGVYSPKSGLSFWQGASTEEGPIGFISQSGTFAVFFLRIGKVSNIKFSKAISYGNAIDLDCPDFLEYLGDDPETKIIAFYIEGTRNGRRLRLALEKVAKKKPVVALKGGMTEHGSRAAFSHTGALAGSPEIWKYLFKQTGVVEVETFDELIDVTLGLFYMPLPQGKGISIITTSGGFSVIETDLCVKMGLEVPQFSDETIRELMKIVPLTGIGVRNPLDAWPVFASGTISDAIKLIAFDEKIHSVIIDINEDVLSGYFKVRWGEKFEDRLKNCLNATVEGCKYVRNKIKKPIALCIPFSSIHLEEDRKYLMEARTLFQNEGFPVYSSIERAAKVISKLVQYHSSKGK
jgi:acyl-CoA synthetase (NDP forming)